MIKRSFGSVLPAGRSTSTDCNQLSSSIALNLAPPFRSSTLAGVSAEEQHSYNLMLVLHCGDGVQKNNGVCWNSAKRITPCQGQKVQFWFSSQWRTAGVINMSFSKLALSCFFSLFLCLIDALQRLQSSSRLPL